MPASRRSLQVTSSYRARLDAIRLRLDRLAADAWPRIESLNSTDWPERMAAAVTQAQTEAIRVTGGYLTAYLTSEIGRRTRGPAIESRSYAGYSRDGRALREALESPLIGVRSRLAEGQTPTEALEFGWNRAIRTVGEDFDHAHTLALTTAIRDDDRFEGWQRATTGTCGACAALSANIGGGLHFPRHPNCKCVSQPVVKGVNDNFPLLAGAAIFAAKSQTEQDEMLGPETAQAVREGRVRIDELVSESQMETGENFITQKPLKELLTATATESPATTP